MKKLEFVHILSEKAELYERAKESPLKEEWQSVCKRSDDWFIVAKVSSRRGALVPREGVVVKRLGLIDGKVWVVAFKDEEVRLFEVDEDRVYEFGEGLVRDMPEYLAHAILSRMV